MIWEKISHYVAPFVGAWIEIACPFHLSRSVSVAPFVGAWIEIQFEELVETKAKVAPFVGAWIEIPAFPSC